MQFIFQRKIQKETTKFCLQFPFYSTLNKITIEIQNLVVVWGSILMFQWDVF